MRVTSGFWYVTYCGERSRKVLQPDRAQRDIREEFSGAPVQPNWVAPKYEIIGKGLWPDWMAYIVPLLSDKAILSLGELLAPHAEFLPWIKEPGHNYTLLNVTRRIPRANWSCEKSSIYNGMYAAADVITLHDVQIPHVFRLEGYEGKTFVSDALAHRSVECGLKGTAFVHPSIPAIHLGFIPFRFGRKGTGFVGREDGLETAKQNPMMH